MCATGAERSTSAIASASRPRPAAVIASTTRPTRGSWGSGRNHARRGNLRGMARALYGRDPDLHALAALLVSHRLVSIVGTAGVGKTALASRLAQLQRER